MPLPLSFDRMTCAAKVLGTIPAAEERVPR
jgi:hypothetical protein